MKNHKVIVYSTTTCPYCVMAKDWFKEKGVAYEDKNVGTDRAARQEMVTKSDQMGVPVIDIDGEILVGFQPEAFAEFLK
jgi:glutaredoxin 3